MIRSVQAEYNEKYVEIVYQYLESHVSEKIEYLSLDDGYYFQEAYWQQKESAHEHDPVISSFHTEGSANDLH